MADLDIAQDGLAVSLKSTKPSAKKSKHESREHFEAKCRLARWLYKSLDHAHFSVVLEYPFGEDGEGIFGWGGLAGRTKPSLAQIRSRHVITAFIADIAIVENGRVTSAIEVVHSHWTEPHKARYFQRHGVPLFEAMSDAILALPSAPTDFDSIIIPV